MAADCVLDSWFPRLESVGVVENSNPPMDGAKQAQRRAKPGEGGGLRCSKLWRGGCDVLAMSMVYSSKLTL
jgi:hypothetical protein